MKYFNELTESDKERALNKLLAEKKLKFKCLTRAIVHINNEDRYFDYVKCSVIKYYWYNVENEVIKSSELVCDIVLDSDLCNVVKAIPVKNLMMCDTPLEIKPRNTEDINTAKQSLIALLSSGKHYVFDHKCNAYPV